MFFKSLKAEVLDHKGKDTYLMTGNNHNLTFIIKNELGKSINF